MSLVPKVKYLNNKELLSAIHESKCTFCEFVDKKYSSYDIIVSDLSSVTLDVLEAARQKKIATIMAEDKKAKVVTPNLDHIVISDVTVRLMTFEHIPLNPEKTGKTKTVAERHIRCNFPPFQHWIWENDEWHCVGRSHWKNGEFNLRGGKTTNRLAMMWMKLVERYGHRGNWRGYTYVDEMKAQALVQLSQVGLQFDESKSSNPFAYLTSCVHTSFLKILNLEKRSQSIRDDLLIMHGATPSMTRQVEDQMAQRMETEPGQTPEPTNSSPDDTSATN